jgi:hypothetical protein
MSPNEINEEAGKPNLGNLPGQAERVMVASCRQVIQARTGYIEVVVANAPFLNENEASTDSRLNSIAEAADEYRRSDKQMRYAFDLLARKAGLCEPDLGRYFKRAKAG